MFFNSIIFISITIIFLIIKVYAKVNAILCFTLSRFSLIRKYYDLLYASIERSDRLLLQVERISRRE